MKKMSTDWLARAAAAASGHDEPNVLAGGMPGAHFANVDMSRPVTPEEWKRTRACLAALPKLQEPPAGYWDDLAAVTAHWPTLPESQDADAEPLL